jgi:hypothetical protein
MISPISHPTNFEDPRSNTSIRPIYIFHEIDDNFITGGGDVQTLQCQIRYAVSENLAIIATKAGWIDFNPDEALTEEEGWGNATAGFKYAFHRDTAKGSIATLGLRYEAPIGNRDVFFGDGDGHVNPFFSAAAALGDSANVMVGTGVRYAISSEDSTFWDLDLHFDYNMGGFYPTVEIGMQHVIDAGNRLPIADEGQDFFSFGASGADGKTMVSGGVGARYRVSDAVDLGVMYQVPLTSGAGSNILDWRLTTDVIVSFDL